VYPGRPDFAIEIGLAPMGIVMQTSKRSFSGARWLLAALLLVTTVCGGFVSAATTTLSDLPLYSASNVPANLMLALSVEYPTAVVAAYKDAKGIPYVYTDATGKVVSITTCGGVSNNVGSCYYPAMRYLGYFDNAKCYAYDDTNKYFKPVKVSTSCSGYWSGNMLNWALMTSLDEFRQALTGGSRSVDTATTTVLIRSKLGSQSSLGNFPDRVLDSNSNVSPSTVVGDTDLASQSTLYIRSYNQNTTFVVSTSSKFDQTGKKQKTFNAQVLVCDPSSGGVLLESNCKAYGSNYKPEGLIQQNFERIRVGASAYTYKFTSTGADYPNGTIRALLRDNGPTKYNGNGARQINPYAEWSASDGTFVANPAGSDGLTAAATAPTDSGVINYLNKFGNTNDYERYDTIADLYWATLAYYMHVPLADSYTSHATATNSLDTTFPVFKGRPDANGAYDTNDPIAYTCQSNAILMIGDSHTHCDSGVPTSKGTIGTNNTCGTDNRTALSPINGADAGLYVDALGNLPLIEADPSSGTAASVTMAKLQGVTSLAATAEAGAGTDATYNMAGLAYFAHTQDIRPDKTFPGKQTVDTYVVDVMEPSTFSGSSGNEIFSLANAASAHGPNMYWLATKYGGFNDINGDGKPANFLTWHTNTSTVAAKDLRPDNYFIGNRPDLIVAGLSSIFSNVSSTKSLSAAGPSVSPSRVLTDVAANTAPFNSPKAGFPTYTTSYLPGVWTGEVNGYVAAAAVGDNVSPVAGGNQWSASSQLLLLTSYVSADASIKGWRDLRRIVTNNSGGVSFAWSELSTSQKTALRNDSTLLDYLRGDRTNESTKFRVRNGVLGDIVNSQATLVQGALSNQYVDAANPGYRAFVTKVANRAPVVYVGANDGMMHAFAADFSATPTGVSFGGGGQELWAYVPSFLFSGPNGTPDVDGLAALSNLKGVTTNAYTHHFYVDQTPQVADVDFAWTSTAPALQGTRGTTPDWHTLLVGGVGKGGKGIYALDVTAVPTPIGNSKPSMTDIKSKVLWEFTNTNLGYTYARPLVVKTRKYGWVVLVTSGYNNSTGKGYLFILDAKTGTLLETLATSIGSATSPVGLGRPSAFTQDISDNTIEQVYAGDLLGNVWRFDLSMSGDGKYPSPVVFAQVTDPTGKPQPITTAPRIETDYSASGLDTRRWVFVGTGKFLDTSDLTDTQVQSMYALRDGSGSIPATTGLPLTRDMLASNDLSTNLNLQDGDKGWVYDLTGKADGTGGATERIVVDPDAVAGIFAINWGTLIPTTDPCSLKGAVYSSTFASGQSNLLSTGGTPLKYITTTSAITNLQAVQLPNGKFVLLYGQTSDLPATANMQSGSSINGVTRTNWREVLN